MPLPAAEPPPPFSMPAFVRETPVVSIEHTSAVIGLGDRPLLDATGDVAIAHSAFVTVELPVLAIDRGWFVGARWGYIGSVAPGRPSETFVTSPELWWRVASVGTNGIGSGVQLSAVVPFRRELDDDALAVLRIARVIRPGDDVLVRDRAPTLRPSFDIRYSRHSFLLQVRQGVDFAGSLAGAGQLDLIAHGAIFAGFLPDPDLLVGSEVREVYALTEHLGDDRRAAVSIAPGIKARLGAVEPSLVIELPLSTPLAGEARAFVAFELGVSFVLGASAHAQSGPIAF